MTQINVGNAANDGTGDPLRTALQKANAAIRLTDTVFPAGVGIWVDNYASAKASGLPADGTDDTPMFQAAEAARTAGQTLFCTPGSTYLLSGSTGPNLFRITKSGALSFIGATIKYGGAGNLAGGGDGGPLGVINLLSSDFVFQGGTLDGNGKARYLIALNGTPVSGVYIQCTIQNTLETSGVWPGIVYSVSTDVPGGSTTLRAKNITGIIRRPSCPIMDNAGAIFTHADVSAVIFGGGATQNNVTGFAYCMSDNGLTCFSMVLSTVGVLSFGAPGLTNTFLTDFGCHDIGCNVIELYGNLLPQPKRGTFSVGGAYTPDIAGTGQSSGSCDHFVTLTANVAVTVANPTSLPSVDRSAKIRFVFFNNSGGALTTPISINGTKYKTSGTVSPANGQRITVEFMYDQTNDTLVESFRSAAV